MRKGLLLAAVACFLMALGIAVFVWHHRQKNEPGPVIASIPGRQLDSSLAVLLRESGKDDPDHRSHFFKLLAELAQKNGLGTKDYVPDRNIDEGYAVEIEVARDIYVVAILRGEDHVIPGSDTQYLVLLNRSGRLLDKLSCAINNRLTRVYVDHNGIFRTDASAAGERDGAHLIVRYIPEDGGKVSGNWSHEITHAGKTTTRSWEGNRSSAIWPGGWDEAGLCRVAIRDGRFFVLFPPAEE